MYSRSSSFLLRWLKVPPEPQAPFGAPESLRVFRAGKNYLKFRTFKWVLGQSAALVGIIFWTSFFVHVEQSAREEKQARAARAAVLAANPTPPAEAVATPASTPETEAKTPTPKRKKRVNVSGWDGFKRSFVELALRLPPWAFPLIWTLKIIGFLLYILQIPLTYSIMRLDYEMRWYVVTDRSLRIRSGVWSVQELTMSFANLQQVVVTQGPIQRMLKLADVRVQSAGGGGSGNDSSHGEMTDSLHTGLFQGVDNAHEIRDLILARLRRFRESGLGDPDEAHRDLHSDSVASIALATPTASHVSPEALAAARELAAEARALRISLS
jgi:membrane protein YdbS with pleckstrin-like domain